MSGIIIATALVGGTGLLLGLVSRVFRPDFSMWKWMRKRRQCGKLCREITAAAAVSRAVTPVLVLSLPGKLR